MLLGTFITLPSDFASSTLMVAGGLVGDLSPLTITVVGVLLAVTVVAVLIRVFTKH